MSSKAVERDLLSLLPSITLPLPQELLEVTISLLSQSRNKAGTLRQDEEIARGYVCANIACDRLKTKLNLPTIVVRPPVGPKTYKKVYAFLDSALTAGTPHKKQKHSLVPNNDPSTPSKQRVQSVSGTPSKTPTKTPTKTPQAKTPGSTKSSIKRKRDETGDDDDLPAWVMPAIRAVSKALDIPQAAPHIFVGVSSIAKSIQDKQNQASSTPAKKRSKKSANEDISAIISSFDETHIPALIVVITFFSRSHLLGAPEEGEYASQRSSAMQAVSKLVPGDVRKDDETTIAMIEDLLREAEDGWLDMEWYHNLPEPMADLDTAGDDDEIGETNLDEDNERPVQALQVPKRGFGSMMTAATDYLSDERRADYKRWKAGILKKLAQVERHGNGKALIV